LADNPGTRVGVVPHPTRDLQREMGVLRDWAQERASEVVQVGAGREREVAALGDIGECDLVVTLGGDGTTLKGIRASAAAGRPVLGVACGSLGVLTTVGVDALPAALDRFTAGDWVARAVPALDARRDDGAAFTALNDIALLRSGEGQVSTEASVDGVLYVRVVGDGFVVSTPVGTSAYTLAAGGPLLAPGATAFVLTLLTSHGGTAPPLVIGSQSTLDLRIDLGHGAARLEVDGASDDSPPGSLHITLEPDMATLVSFDDAEPLLSGLRQRRIITDSPRVLARDEREGEGGSGESV
jgi:NAD+ kinase